MLTIFLPTLLVFLVSQIYEHERNYNNLFDVDDQHFYCFVRIFYLEVEDLVIVLKIDEYESLEPSVDIRTTVD